MIFYPESIDLFLPAMGVDNRNALAYFGISDSLLELGRIDESLRYAVSGLEIDPDNGLLRGPRRKIQALKKALVQRKQITRF